MDIAGSTDQFSELSSQIYDFFVDLNEILLCLYGTLFITQHESVVSQRLNLQIVVEIYQS